MSDITSPDPVPADPTQPDAAVAAETETVVVEPDPQTVPVDTPVDTPVDNPHPEIPDAAQIGQVIDLTVDNPDHPVELTDAQTVEAAKSEVVDITDGEGNTVIVTYGSGLVTTIPVYDDTTDYSVPAVGLAQKPLYLD